MPRVQRIILKPTFLVTDEQRRRRRRAQRLEQRNVTNVVAADRASPRGRRPDDGNTADGGNGGNNRDHGDHGVRWSIRIDESSITEGDRSDAVESVLKNSGGLWQLTPRDDNGGRHRRRWKSLTDVDQDRKESNGERYVSLWGNMRSGNNNGNSVEASVRVSVISVVSEQVIRGRSHKLRVCILHSLLYYVVCKLHVCYIT